MEISGRNASSIAYVNLWLASGQDDDQIRKPPVAVDGSLCARSTSIFVNRNRRLPFPNQKVKEISRLIQALSRK